MATLRCAYCPAKGRRSFARERGDAIPTCARHELNALHTIELDKDVLVDIAELNPDAQTGMMVAIPLPDALAQSAAIPDGVPVEQMHITLAYLGQVGDGQPAMPGDEPGTAIAMAIKPVLDACAPLTLEIMGTARFAPEPPDEPDDNDEPSETVEGEYPFVLLVSPSPELCALQCAVADALEAAGIQVMSDYDYIPHVTLDYIALEDEDPARVAHPMSFEVDAVAVYVAEYRYDMPLGGTAEPDQAPDAEMSKALYGIDTAVAKADAEMRYTLAPVYLPDTEDAHGEFVDAPTLQKAFWGYLENSREIHLQHTDTPAGTLVECVTWPAEFNTTLTVPGEEPKPITFPAGTVYAGIIWDESSWALIKAGKLRGLSMGGRAKKVYADFDE